ncbi:MAG: undecaprenyldiphospho-muramoylpentapeptide beta-N-acetylglucosaminyltransferase [Bacteroidia bacterium]|nr:undecaprenyldiphospho-muramoylpentapeptide beta-N-acetylglucosaminyltransferase [Bacteroidia bacterium]
MQRRIKIIISGGGTGGHIFPALAIANALKEMNRDNEILFVGALGKMEMEKIPAAGYNIIGLNIRGLQRKISVSNLLFPFRLAGSIWKSKEIIRDFKPDAAVGVGGYASGPLLWAASSSGIPCLIQEQNSFPGITNRMLAKRVRKICVAYEGMNKFFPDDKIIITGNPVRKDITQLLGKKEEAIKFFGLDRNRKTLLVLGGSLGARTINESIDAGIKEISSSGIQILWQTGKGFYEKAKASAGEPVKVFDFINRMDLAYSAADVVVSRAGALSVSEICISGKPVIFVPSPNVTADHQTSNARALTERNAALLVHDEEAQEKLVDEAIHLMSNEEKCAELSENILAFAKKDAAEKIAELIYELTGTND